MDSPSLIKLSFARRKRCLITMTERAIFIQYAIHQRNEHPTGIRIWSDGLVQRCSAANPLPLPTDNLERDRDLIWEDDQQKKALTADQLNTLADAVRQSSFFALPPRLLINYCKEDPGTMIWTITLDGQTGRVVVFDPRPKRSPELDILLKILTNLLV